MLVLVSHPYLEQSHVHRELTAAARTVAGVEVRHVESIALSNRRFDPRTEQAIIEQHQTVVLQYPLYWYATPPALKQYLDDVLTADWTFPDGDKLAGRTLAVAVTMGALEETYAHDGLNEFTIDEVLVPMQMTATACGMKWATPWTVFNTPNLGVDGVRAAADSYAAYLRGLGSAGIS